MLDTISAGKWIDRDIAWQTLPSRENACSRGILVGLEDSIGVRVSLFDFECHEIYPAVSCFPPCWSPRTPFVSVGKLEREGLPLLRHHFPFFSLLSQERLAQRLLMGWVGLTTGSTVSSRLSAFHRQRHSLFRSVNSAVVYHFESSPTIFH